MDSTTFGAVGAAYAVIFGAGLLRARRSTTADSILAALCGGAGVAILAILAQHDARLAAFARPLERLELTTTLLCGPLLFLYFRAALLGAPARKSDLTHALPAALSLLVAAPIELVVLHQVAYSASAAWLLQRHGTAGDIDPFHRLVTRGLVVFFATVHAAQAIRFTWTEVDPVRNVVPVAAAGAILFLGLGLSIRGNALQPPLPRYRRSSLAVPDAQQCLDRLDRLMRDEQPYRQRDLSLATLAARLGVTPHHLSQSLNQHRGTTLVDYLALWRVDEAKRQLLDPARDHLTIDAIAESAGFGSRSAFYGSFRRLAGVTPSELRKRSGTSFPIGTDESGPKSTNS